MKPSKALLAHHKRLLDPKHVWEKCEINALSTCINSAAYEKDADKKAFKMELLQLVNSGSFPAANITKEQVAFGKEWLKNALFTPSGKPRNSKLAKSFGHSAVEIVKNLKTFKFVGFATQYQSYRDHSYIVAPVYRAIAKNGDSFKYAPIHWGPCLVDGEIEMSCS